MAEAIRKIDPDQLYKVKGSVLIDYRRVKRDVGKLSLAVTDEGPQPRHHRTVMNRHRKEWPTLWDAIDRLVDNE